jgi:hypothetical protein
MTTHTIELVGGPRDGNVVEASPVIECPGGTKLHVHNPMVFYSNLLEYDDYHNTHTQNDAGNWLFEYEEAGG